MDNIITILYFFSTEVLVLVHIRCISNILLVYTTSVDIDQRFIVSDASTPQSGAQYMYE